MGRGTGVEKCEVFSPFIGVLCTSVWVEVCVCGGGWSGALNSTLIN